MTDVYLGKAFSSDPAIGNLAGIVFDQSGMMTETTMQHIAYEIGAAETVFLSPSQNGADIKLRWFTPTTEVGMCVHATVVCMGGLKLLADKGVPTIIRPAEKLRVETKNDILNIRLTSETVMVCVKGYEIILNPMSQTLVAEMLSLSLDSFVSDGRIVQIGSDREFVIEVATLKDLSALTLTVDGYTLLCQEAGVSGISIFCRETYDSQCDIHTREFAPMYGYLEDPLCGTAAGAIFTVLKACNETRRTLLVEQGHFTGTSGVIYVNDANDGVWIGGEYALCGKRVV